MRQREYLPAIEPSKQVERDLEWLKEEILLDKDPAKKTATITFNRPEALNALQRSHEHYINKLVGELDWDDEVKVIIFKGAGRSFGSGHDVLELGTMHGHGTQGGKERRPSQKQRLLVDRCGWVAGSYVTIVAPILHSVKTTIAQVQGHCYGYHFQLAMACDLIIAAEDAKFTHPGFKYIGPTLDLALWLQIMGLRRLKEMVLTGKAFTAQEAMQFDLINRVVPLDQLEAEVDKWAQAAATLPMDGIVMGKSFLQGVMDAAGVGTGQFIGQLGHAMQTAIHYEPGEFNLLRDRRDKGLKGAIANREGKYAAEFTLR